MEEKERNFEFTSKLTFHDYLLYIYMINKNNFLRYGIISFVIVMLFPMIAVKNGNYTNLFLGITKPLAIYVLVMVVLLISIRFNAKKYWDTNSFIKEEQNIKLSNEGIEYSSGISITNISWDKLYKVVEAKKYIYIFLTNSSAYIIPKISFKSNEEINLVKQLILDKADKKIVEFI